MSDLAQILGVSGRPGSGGGGSSQFPLGNSADATKLVGRASGNTRKKAGAHKTIQKLNARSREVMGLLGPTASAEDAAAATAAAMTVPLPPAVPGGLGVRKSAILATPNEPGSVKVGNRWIKIQTPARKWTWAPFSSSSRTDGSLFHHWVRAGVEYPDYPYARFDIHLDPLSYTLEEYEKYLQSDSWTKSETDRLMDLARQLELRWPVIHDRWIEIFDMEKQSGDGNDPPKTQRNVEDLQFRYYQVAALINQARIVTEAQLEAQMLNSASPDPNDPDPKAATDHLLYETAAARHLATIDPSQQPLITITGTGTSNKVFDLNYEKERRAFLEAQWNRTKEEEMEEAALRRELKQIEAQLRKMKKSGAHILEARKLGVASCGTTALPGSAASSRNPSRSVSPLPGASAVGAGAAGTITGEPPAAAALDSAFASTAPVPVPGIPYLQSGRLVEPATGGAAGLNKTLLSRMEAVLHELKVPPQLLPTQRNCDLYDAVRKDIVTLLILQKNVLQKEGLLQKKRMGVEKLLGSAAAAGGAPTSPSKMIVTEETVMGIMPPSPAPSPAQPSKPKPASKSKAGAGKGGNTGKKGGGKGGGKKAAASAATDVTEDTKGASDKKEGGKGGKQAAGKAAGGKQATVAAGKGGATKKSAAKRKRKGDTNSKSPVPTNPGMAPAASAEVSKPSAKKRKKSTATASAAGNASTATTPAPASAQKK